MSFLENPDQSIGFLLLCRCLLWMSGELIDVRESAVRRGFLRFQFCRLVKIAQRLGILEGALSVAAKRERREEEQIGGPSILCVEFVGVLKRLICRKIFPQLGQNRPIQGSKLKYVGPACDRRAEGRAGRLQID